MSRSFVLRPRFTVFRDSQRRHSAASVSDPAEAGAEALELIYENGLMDVINVALGTVSEPFRWKVVVMECSSHIGGPLEWRCNCFYPEYRPAESFELLISDPKISGSCVNAVTT